MRIAVVTSHPIQYNAPWFRFLAGNGLPDLRVFYLWTSGVTPEFDRGFGRNVSWDIPLLDGYAHEFVPNWAPRPGSHSALGLWNPALRSRLDAFQPDCILMLGYNYLSCYRLLFSRRNVPLLFRGDSHRLVLREETADQLRRRWIRRVFRKFSAFLYVGKANRAYFTHHGVSDERLFFSPHAVDNARYFSAIEQAAREAVRWRAELGIAPSRKVILFAGKFEPKKRPRDLVAAFQKAGLRDVTLVMVGGGEQEGDLRRDAAGSADIVFLPFQNQSEMPRTYMLGDLLVLPSHGPGESWGLSVNEAMCLGRPVIVSTHVGCAQDLVHPGRNGLVFPAGDVTALADVLREAVSSTDRLTRWGEQSREIIATYSYTQASEGLFSALASVRAAAVA